MSKKLIFRALTVALATAPALAMAEGEATGIDVSGILTVIGYGVAAAAALGGSVLAMIGGIKIYKYVRGAL